MNGPTDLDGLTNCQNTCDFYPSSEVTKIEWDVEEIPNAGGYFGFTAFDPSGSILMHLPSQYELNGGKVAVFGNVGRIQFQTDSSNGIHTFVKIIFNGTEQHFQCINCVSNSPSIFLHRLYLDTDMNGNEELEDAANCQNSCDFYPSSEVTRIEWEVEEIANAAGTLGFITYDADGNELLNRLPQYETKAGKVGVRGRINRIRFYTPSSNGIHVYVKVIFNGNVETFHCSNCLANSQSVILDRLYLDTDMNGNTALDQAANCQNSCDFYLVEGNRGLFVLNLGRE